MAIAFGKHLISRQGFAQAKFKHSCFPHVINISVKTGLKYLTDTSIFDPDISPTDPLFEATQALRDDVEYWQTLKNDVVGRARRLVAACRASGQRREDFKSIIVDGNENGSWGDAGLLRVIVLLRDVDTRWSSTFLMIDRVLELHLVSLLHQNSVFVSLMNLPGH